MIVYYDGVCALCNRFVQWALRNDAKGTLRFAALDSTHGRRLRRDHPETSAFDSIVVQQGERIYVRSEAILEICRELGGVWHLGALGRLLPRSVRDWMYNLIARRRYRWFGRLDACPMPGPEVRGRFLT